MALPPQQRPSAGAGSFDRYLDAQGRQIEYDTAQDAAGQFGRLGSGLLGRTTGRGAWDQRNAIVMLARDPDPATARQAYADGVREGLFDPQLSPAAASWAVDLASGAASFSELPPAVRNELTQANALADVAGTPDSPLSDEPDVMRQAMASANRRSSDPYSAQGRERAARRTR